MPIFKPYQQQSEAPPVESTRAAPQEPQRKGILGRLRNLQLSRPDPKPEILPDNDPQPVDSEAAAKAARREARRERRRKREEEWNEEFRRRRNYAIEVGVEMRPLTPLSDFDSASEDERQPTIQKPPPAQTYNPAQQHEPLVGEGLNPPTSSLPPPLATQPDVEHSQPGIDPSNPEKLPPPLQTAQPPRDPKEDSQLAEMFAAQAFNAPSSSMPSQSYAHASYSASQPQHAQASPIGWGGVYHSVPSQPMYGTPHHLTPVPHTVRDIDPILADNIRRGRELAMLAIEQEERGNLGAAEAGYIKALSLLVPASKQLDTGSELNKNARIQQKAKIKREAAAMLDRCEELRVFLRANGPSVPTEMPIMPNETTTGRPTSTLKSKSSLGAPPSRDLPPPPPTQPHAPTSLQAQMRSDRDISLPPPPSSPPQLPGGRDRSHLLNRLTSRKDVLASASTVIPSDTSRQIPPDSSPEIPPDTFRRIPSDTSQHIPSDASRHIPSDASRHIPPDSYRDIPPDAYRQSSPDAYRQTPPDTYRQIPPDSSPRIPSSDPEPLDYQQRRTHTGEKCFMCSAPAHLRTKCGHTYCSNCGNQAVSVFGQCPVPDCGAQIAVEEFEHIL